MDWRERITIDPGTAAGHPVIKGTRVPVHILIGSLAGGDSMQDVCEAYKVTEEDLRAALVYASEVIAGERVRALPG